MDEKMKLEVKRQPTLPRVGNTPTAKQPPRTLLFKTNLFSHMILYSLANLSKRISCVIVFTPLTALTTLCKYALSRQFLRRTIRIMADVFKANGIDRSQPTSSQSRGSVEGFDTRQAYVLLCINSLWSSACLKFFTLPPIKHTQQELKNGYTQLPPYIAYMFFRYKKAND